MRDNTPTARLEDTPTSEQDLSTTPVRAAPPQVVDVICGPQAWHLTLELEDGERVDLSPDRMKWAALHPGGQGIGPMVVIGWLDRTSVVYAVPTTLLPELLPYFPGLEEQS